MNSEILKNKIAAVRLKEAEGFSGLLGVKFIDLTPEHIKAQLEVLPTHYQPFGIMHGGVSLALAETVASIGGWLNAEDECQIVGVELNANHLRPVTRGILEATAKPVHLGKRTQVWSIELQNESRLVCLARCTLMVVLK